MNINNQLSVIILTHNRVHELRRTLDHMCALPENPSIVVVDNASIDNTSILVNALYPQVTLIKSPQNIGASARNLGVQHAKTPYIAFCDDDTWWEPGALIQATNIMDMYPNIGVLCARVLVGSERKEDPTSTLMGNSPFASKGLPGRSILGFLAGASVFRRQAFLQAGGYEKKFFIGGEEALLATDLIMRGWALVYLPQLIVHHHPSINRDSNKRKKLLVRNAIWLAWMRRPWGSALKLTWRSLATAYKQSIFWSTLSSSLKGLAWAFQNRRVISHDVEMKFRQLE